MSEFFLSKLQNAQFFLNLITMTTSAYCCLISTACEISQWCYKFEGKGIVPVDE